MTADLSQKLAAADRAALDAVRREAEQALAYNVNNPFVLGAALRCLLTSTSDLVERLATAERDIATFIESASDAHKRAEAAERERDEARRIAAEHRCVEINPTNCPTCSPLALAWDNPEDAVYDAAPTASRPMTRDEAEAVEEIESAMFTAPPPDAAREAKRRCACGCEGDPFVTPPPISRPVSVSNANAEVVAALDQHRRFPGPDATRLMAHALETVLRTPALAPAPSPSTHALLKVEVKP